MNSKRMHIHMLQCKVRLSEYVWLGRLNIHQVQACTQYYIHLFMTLATMHSQLIVSESLPNLHSN